MRRIDRARIVRDAILEVPRDEWKWKEIGDQRFLEVFTPDWHASLSTEFSGGSRLPEAQTMQQALILQRAAKPLPNVLDLWVTGKGKVLSVEYDADEIRLISMKRGDWEADLFGLPPYCSGS